MQIKYFDTFTGYGGFTLGIQRAFGVDTAHEQKQECGGKENIGSPPSGSEPQLPSCIGYSEVNKYAIQVYEKHFPEQLCELHNRHQATGQAESISGDKPNTPSEPAQRTTTCNCRHKNYGDITQINPAELPDFDLLTGGFPCQAFSIAGKRQGFNDTRGTLFFDIARILKEKRPRNFILENVKGLLSHDNGRTFKTIITTLVELGYCVEWQVLNAKDFGVPQNRERVFIVGHFGGIPERKVFPIGEDDREDTLASEGSETGVLPTIRATHYKSGDNQPVIANTIDANYYKGLNKNPGHASSTRGYKLNGRVRRLTPIECERLMGLPDDWTISGRGTRPAEPKDFPTQEESGIHYNYNVNYDIPISDTQRYKLCGNGVVVNVVEAVVRKLYGL